MSKAYKLAEKYYPDLWGKEKIRKLVEAGKLTEEEYDRLVDYAISLGVENGYIQEGGTADESFIPVWDGSGL